MEGLDVGGPRRSVSGRASQLWSSPASIRHHGSNKSSSRCKAYSSWDTAQRQSVVNPANFAPCGYSDLRHADKTSLSKRRSESLHSGGTREAPRGSVSASLAQDYGLGTSSASLGSSSALELGCFMGMLHDLLSACEVKFTLQLLEELCKSRSAKYVLSSSGSEFAQDLETFADSECHRSSSQKLGPVGLVKTVASRMGIQQGKVNGKARASQVSVMGRSLSAGDKGPDVPFIPEQDTPYSSAGSGGGMEPDCASPVTLQPESAQNHQTLEKKDTSDPLNAAIMPTSPGYIPQRQKTPDAPLAPSPMGLSRLVPAMPSDSRRSSAQSASAKGHSSEESRRVAGTQSDYSEGPKPSPSDVSRIVEGAQSERAGVTQTDSSEGPKSSPSTVSRMASVASTTARGSANRASAVIEHIDLDDVNPEQANWMARPSDRLVAHPNSRSRVAWDFFVIVLIVIECVTLPLNMAFEINLPTAFHVLSMLLFSTDMVMSFTTGYYHSSYLIMRRSWIVKHYLRTWFVLDFVSLFPWEEVFGLLQLTSREDNVGGKKTTFLRILKLGKLLRVLRLLRLAKIGILVKRLQTGGILPSNMLHLKFGMSVAKMFVIFGFLSHWAACFWGWIGDPELLGGDTNGVPHNLEICTMGGPCEPGIQGSPWRRRYGIDNYDASIEYFAALQYTAALITGGESPLQASNPVERVFAIVVMICSIFVSAVVVGEILLIMSRQLEVRMVFDEQMQQARDFMVARKVPMPLQSRVYRYLETQHVIQHGHSNSNRTFMATLSGQLQSELVEQLNSCHILKHPFFQDLEDTNALKRICAEASPAIFATSEFLCEKGTPATCMHFLVHGKVRVENPLVAGGKVLYLKPPSWLGDLCLFVDTLRKNTVTAVVTSETLNLEKASLLAVCRDSPSVRESFEAFRDKVMKDKWQSLVCPRCGDIGHSEEACGSPFNSAG